MNRARAVKTVLWAIVGLAFSVALTRFFFGLGATTNLTDEVPWGFWIGFDVMGGVALAAGGFVLTATVYIFGRRQFHPIVRPAVLTAFLGYAAVVGGLLFDLGLPWNIWHMVVFWNPHSPLFEVGWCVMLYLTVLLLEFAPVPLEDQPRWKKIYNALTKARIPLVITGIALSTLHQSSLGTLFTIMPYRVHPLWYSPILPILFFFSAIALGLFMVTFEGQFTSWVYRRETHTKLLAKLNRATPWLVLLYLLLRFGDLAARGQLGATVAADWHAVVFWLEVAAFLALPAVLMGVKRVRLSSGGQAFAAFLGVFGVVLNRVNTGGVMHVDRGLEAYLPSWTEVTVSFGVVSAAALVFLFAVEHFHILEKKPVDEDADPTRRPELHPVDRTWLGAPEFASRARHSLAFVLMAGLGFFFLSGEQVASKGVEPVPARAARGGDTLWVDGNHDSYGVAFTHAGHIAREEGDCAACHHMNLPGDQQSTCAACHRYQVSPADAFRHDWHADPEGAAIACAICHAPGEVKNAAHAKACEDCHEDLFPEVEGRDRVSPWVDEVEQYMAPGYAQAMHGLCIDCHKARAARLEKENLPRCTQCHRELRRFVTGEGVVQPLEAKSGVIVPGQTRDP